MTIPETPSPESVGREAAIQQMREALESAYCYTFNLAFTSDESEQVHEEILEACSAADRVGIICGNEVPAFDARIARIAEIIQDGIHHDMGSLTIARSIHAALRARP